MGDHRFIFLRTKSAIDLEEKVLESLADHFPYSSDDHLVDLVGFGESECTWENGLMMRISSDQPVRVIAERLRPALATCDAWIVYHSAIDFVEFPVSGLVSKFFGQAWDDDFSEAEIMRRTDGGRISQIFAMSPNSDSLYEQTINQIRASMVGECLPVFHFRNGQVMFLNSREPAGITAQRCMRFLRRLEHWAITDPEGNTLSDDGDDVWRATELAGLRFSGFEQADFLRDQPF